MPVRSVVFDVGETLMADGTFWGAWARWIGVPPHTLSALVGAVTALGLDNAEALRLIRPGFDVDAERAKREVTAGFEEVIADADLYGDVRSALASLRSAGFWVGVAGNQTARAAELLRALELPVDAVATSGEWGVAKPATAFFDRVATWCPGARDEIVYVGDHLRNDILPAREAGILSVHIRRGPLGYLDSAAAREAATWQVDSLEELPALLIQQRNETGF